MIGIINGIVTLLALLTFVGIVFWAFSKSRVNANTEASMLPFALPDEGLKQPNTNASQPAHDSAGGSHE